jgi:TolB protein
VYVINADGTGFVKVTDDPAAEFDPTWSPDGALIAYRHQVTDDRSTDIYVIAADGSSARNVTGDDGAADWGPDWSPDGSWIAWNTAADAQVGFDLGLVHADGTDRRVVKPGVYVEYPDWSSDGRRIAFMSQVAEEGSQYDIFVMDTDGSNVQRLTTVPGVDGWPTWSPDGTSIAFSSTRDDCSQSSLPGCLSTGDIGPYHTLYVMAADGSAQRRVSTLFGQIADWSPDGRFLVFEGQGGLTVISRDGAAVGTIPVDVGAPAFPDWID